MQTTTNDATADLMFELAKLLEKHGARAVLECVADACDAAGDHSRDIVTAKKSALAVRNFDSAKQHLLLACADIERAENIADVDVASAACVLADM